SYQEAIEDITKRMGAGMAKFILKEVETVDDYDEYCHYVAGLVGLGLSKLFHASGKEDLASDSLSNSMGLFLQDLKYEENSGKAVQCLNDMVTNALIHMDDCVKYLSNLKDPSIFRFCAIPQIMAIGTLAMCYNNVEVFRGVVKMRRGLTAKVDKNDPNATKTLSRLEAIQDTCRGSGLLSKRKSYILESKNQHSRFLIVLLVIIMAIVFARLNSK
ncbi:Squalene synthase 2, partial [Linum perenne]